MRAFAVILHKEWREQRGVLLGIVFSLPVLLALAGLTIPSKKLEDSAFAALVALGCFVVGVVALAADLVPGEARRGQLGFLARLPAGLGRVFLAKLALCVLALPALAACGGVAGMVTSRLVTGAWPYGDWDRVLSDDTWLLLPPAVLWVFSVSCWLPVGLLAVPAAAALAGLLLLPVIALHAASPGIALPDPVHVLVGALMGSLLAAFLGFVLGNRRGGRPVRWGLAASLACVAPLWAATGWNALAYHGCVGGEPRIMYAQLTASGDAVYVRRARLLQGLDAHGFPRYGPMSPVVVTLADGSARTATTAECPERSEGSVLLPDGGSLRLERTRMLLVADDGRLEHVEKDWGRWTGLGVQFRRGIYDPFRGRLFAERELGHGLHVLLVRPGRWLARPPRSTWRLFDPETREMGDVRGLGEGEYLGPILDDGRLLVSHKEHGLRALDPESGRGDAIPIEGWAGPYLIPFGGPLRTPGGRRLFMLHGNECALVARFDGARLVPALATRTTRDVIFVACEDEESALVVVDSERLVRVRFGSEDCETIY